jgi:hypothetical protein
MNPPIRSEPAAAQSKAPTRGSALLQRITALVLWAVLFSLAWMVYAAYRPESLRWFSVEMEVIIMLALLLTALILVSVVALLHTRSPNPLECGG